MGGLIAVPNPNFRSIKLNLAKYPVYFHCIRSDRFILFKYPDGLQHFGHKPWDSQADEKHFWRSDGCDNEESTRPTGDSIGLTSIEASQLAMAKSQRQFR